MQSEQLVRTAYIAVDNVSFSVDRLFSYRIPDELKDKAVRGARVLISFGRGGKKRTGLIMHVKEEIPEYTLKPVSSVLENVPIINEEMMNMILWLKENTFCTYFDAVKSIMPSGTNVTVSEKYTLSDGGVQSSLRDDELNLYCFLKNAPGKREFEALLNTENDPKKARVIASLVEKGFLKKESSVQRKVSDRFIKMIKISEHFVNNKTYFKLTAKQQQVVSLLETREHVSAKEACYQCAVTMAVIKNLIKNNIVTEYEVEDLGINETEADPDALGSIVLNEKQQIVCDRVFSQIRLKKPKCFLLHGVTGSGKTSVFIKLIEKTLSEGKQALLLVPEIALTPQVVSQFCRLFGNTVSVIHSDLTPVQRLDAYKRISRGLSDIVIGTRSAVFAPLSNIGIIIMDEEGERTYKSEMSPRYSTAAVAKERCRTHGATLLLGSATPSIESYYYAQKGVYELLTLNERYNKSELPHVEIIDMNDERKNGNTGEFSEVLVHEINENLKRGEQSILLLNRRGYHTVVSCASCSTPLYCPNCSIPYTYHKANNSLVCHYCGSITAPPDKCPSCGKTVFKQIGFGTQKMEEETAALFPKAKILRMDADTTFSRDSYEKQFKAFAEGKYDIMIGTQMIGKGLDFPNVTLVGILSVDKSLYAGDFRSYERAFSLVTQVAGRSGRGGKKGRAYLQTFLPDHYVLNLAANQNYPGFYEEEIVVRKTLMFPPLCDICVIGFSSDDENSARKAADAVLLITKELIAKNNIRLPLRILGPTQSGIIKINGKYRFRLIYKCKNNKELRDFIRSILMKFSEKREFSKVSIFADINGEIM